MSRPPTPRWWHRATGYQVWPRSFHDSDGDGVGDIPGIVSRLDHLRDLGIGFIWLSPVYASPMVDAGYDISDYRAIAPEFGTMEDFDRLVAEARARDIGIVMDLVVNHTSDRHEWFRRAREDPGSPEHALYVWRDPAPDGGPPSDLGACFGGSAWTYVPEIGRYYLGYFSPAQPDLNWQNPDLRARIWDMMNWWLDKGIAGFRMDVISLIGKDVDAGRFEEGPDLHPFLREMHRETLAGRDVLTIGESWSVTRETALDYCGRDRDEIDMVFQFNHVKAGWDPEFGKFRPLPFDLARLKRVLFDWQETLSDDGWNALFWSNHDLPRHLSIWGDDGRFRRDCARSMATALHLLKGTPFVYQGEEIGMTNMAFERLDQLRDLETLGHWREQSAAGVSLEDFLAGANRNGRDNARTPVQWDAGPQAGFTEAEPWIEVNPNRVHINAAADRADPDGIFAHYRRLIALRRDLDIVCFGRTIPFLVDHPAIFAYTRELDGARLSVVVNFGSDRVAVDLPEGLAAEGRCLIATHAPRHEASGRVELAPWESFAILADPA